MPSLKPTTFLAFFLLISGCASSPLGNNGQAEQPTEFSGHYVYFADSATFTLCDSGQRLPIADSPSALIMERAYLASRLEPLTPLAMKLSGKIELRLSMEESLGEIPHLVVDAVTQVGIPLQCKTVEVSP